MNPWKCNSWKAIYSNTNCRTGLRLKFDKDVNPEVKRALKEYCRWLRKTYNFPIRVPVYIKSTKQIKAMDGDMVYGTFLRPYERLVEPYIRISTGDYPDLLSKRGQDKALWAILHCITHELTHYYQWLNNFSQSMRGEERQATFCAGRILDDYAGTREHP